jgi:hypothetical protein
MYRGTERDRLTNDPCQCKTYEGTALLALGKAVGGEQRGHVHQAMPVVVHPVNTGVGDLFPGFE